ncbi:Protein of unknown function DUF1675 [Cynara cardunculus var. scolymus]|uniref:Ninja-family protein n=1 Tax=Cynara cardunculus var. scolymus TaxID=59895 RepID=A0A103Y4Y0_CYNCS|nr:Protein of unknown function DUF1675 [Cynara cardunculus var. scolymus]
MDLLKTFVYDGGAGGVGHSLKEEILVEENVELSLGLSMNGRFGVERRCTVVDNNYSNNDRLSRSSSVTDFSSFPSTNDDPTPLSLYSPLTRTCSLPIETEEWKKRKELQSLRRSEAKRKRVEKLKNGRVVKGSTAEEIYETKRRNLTNGNELWRSSLPSLGGSSGVSDLECQHFSGTNKEVESKSTTSNQSISHKISSSSLNRSNLVASEHVAGKLSATSSQILSGNRSSKDETLKVMLADMPCVSTKGDGINGKKIEGFLYRYRKGEEVRIVCVCHGSFLTPAEFVKHGGGGDVEHPLRHIVVNPPSL